MKCFDDGISWMLQRWLAIFFLDWRIYEIGKGENELDPNKKEEEMTTRQYEEKEEDSTKNEKK